jgi:hypothetical protein
VKLAQKRELYQMVNPNILTDLEFFVLRTINERGGKFNVVRLSFWRSYEVLHHKPIRRESARETVRVFPDRIIWNNTKKVLIRKGLVQTNGNFLTKAGKFYLTQV